MVGPNPDGNYTLVKDRSSSGEAQRVDPGSSQDILPRGAILVKEAAPPQGALSPAAQGSVFGILPRYTVAKNVGVVAVNRNLGQTWVGQPGQEGLESVTIGPRMGLGMGMGMGHVVTMNSEVRQARTLPTGIGPVGMRQVSVNQFQQIPLLEQRVDGSVVPKASKKHSPKKGKTINVVNTIITAETTKTYPPSKEEFMVKNQFKEDSDQAQDMHDATVDEKQEVIIYTSEQHTRLDDEDPDEVVQSAFKDNISIQEYPTQKTDKSSIVNVEEDIVKSLPGPDVLQTSSEQSDTVAEKPGDTMDEIVIAIN